MKTEIKKVVPLSNNIMFKYIFGTSKNKRYTQDLLEKLYNLKEGTLNNIKIINSVNVTKANINKKDFELDIVVELENKNKINIEMYTKYDNNSETKSLMYVTSLLSKELLKGETYDKVKGISQINFVKGNRIHKDNQAIKRYLIMNEDNPSDIILDKLLEIIIVDVDLKSKNKYNKDGFEKYRRLIGAETIEEMEEIVKGEEIMEEIVEDMKKYSVDDIFKGMFHPSRLLQSQLNTAREEGLAQGKEEEIEKIARTMLKEKIDINIISKITGLSIEEIKKLDII